MQVLILGTNRMCHELLRGHGHELVLLVQRDRAKPADVTGPYRHVVVLEDLLDAGLWVDVARVFHRSLGFGAVVAYNEHTYHIVHAVSEALGIPTVVDASLYSRVLDKYQTREILKRHDLPSCRYELARDRESALAAIKSIGLPCIVKPVTGEASAGVVKIMSPAEIDAALDWVGEDHIDRGVLVEELLLGEEFSVEAISVGTAHHIVAVTKKFIGSRTLVERGHVVPAQLSTDTRELIACYVSQVLDTLGFHDCPSHTEIILTAMGPRLIETHNRLGGDSIIDLVHLATGVDMYDLVVRQSLGENVTTMLPGKIEYRESAAIWFADPTGPATNTLAEVRGVEQVRRLPYVKRVELLKELGSPQTELRQSRDRSGSVIAVGDTAQEAVCRAREAARMLQFYYRWTPGEETFAVESY
jgi:biotin carboxylase